METNLMKYEMKEVANDSCAHLPLYYTDFYYEEHTVW